MQPEWGAGVVRAQLLSATGCNVMRSWTFSCFWGCTHVHTYLTMENGNIYWQAEVSWPGKTFVLAWTFGQHHKGCSKYSSCNFCNHFVAITTHASNFRLFLQRLYFSIFCLCCCCIDVSVWLSGFRVQWHGYRNTTGGRFHSPHLKDADIVSVGSLNTQQHKWLLFFATAIEC